MELSDTVTLSNRINNKVNISDTASMLLPYFRDADTSSLNLTSRFALKLNAADTASLSSRINTKGTVSSVATGFGLLGGTITTTGTLLLDSAVVFTRIRDSIVDVAIGNDTIKILKQEYAPALTSVLTWTITPKFPIQLKAYILVFRNGQLLNNDQYNLTDTNKITIVSTSFKVGANYTVATVSGIGSVGSGVFPNPVYPEAGIAVSTGTTWTTSIPNNSNNWNIAYNDKINNAVFTGTDTKTLTLTQLDGGTFTPTFNDLQGVTGVTAGTGLTGGTITTTGTVAVDFGVVAPLANPTFTGTVSGITKSMVGLGNVDNTSDANKPISSATQTALNLKLNISDTSSMLTPYFRDADTTLLNLTSRFAEKQNTLNGIGFVKASGTSISYDNSSYLRTGLADSTYLKLTGGTLTGNLVVNGTTRLIGNVAINTTTAYKPLEVWSNANDFVSVGVKDLNYGEYSGIHFGYVESNSQYRKSAIVFQRTDYSIGDASGKIHFLNVPSFLSGTNASLAYARMTINNNGNVGINDTLPLSTLSVNGTLGVTGAATLSSTLAVTGNITEGGNNVLTNLDTASLSSRIDAKLSTSDTASLSNRINLKYNSSGGTISGAVTLSTTAATPTSLLGKDGSNVVGTVTTVAQTGLFGRGSVTNAITDANGNITVAHGFNFTPIMAFANLPASTTNIVNVKEVDGTNITFIVRDGATNNVLNTQTVTKIEFFAIK
jgi:hypothetical protein